MSIESQKNYALSRPFSYALYILAARSRMRGCNDMSDPEKRPIEQYSELLENPKTTTLQTYIEATSTELNEQDCGRYKQPTLQHN